MGFPRKPVCISKTPGVDFPVKDRLRPGCLQHVYDLVVNEIMVKFPVKDCLRPGCLRHVYDMVVNKIMTKFHVMDCLRLFVYDMLVTISQRNHYVMIVLDNYNVYKRYMNLNYMCAEL